LTQLENYFGVLFIWAVLPQILVSLA